MNGKAWSEFQEGIFTWADSGSGNGRVSAVAGSGKTTTLVEVAKRISGNILFLAFNAHIVKELDGRLAGSSASARTIHSMGNGAVRSHLGGKMADPDARKYNKLCEAWVDKNGTQFPPDERKEIASALAKLVNYSRLTLVDVKDSGALEAMCLHFDIEVGYPSLLSAIPAILQQGQDMARQHKIVDFTDMIWLPVVWSLQLPKHDFVLIDECLPYHTPVHLADGTSLPIGEIVENKLSVSVLAYDTKTGEQKSCAVTGWSKTLNRKPLVKIKARWNVRAGKANRPTNFVVCTTDHKVFANGQWIPAGEIKPGMTVQVETAAKKSQVYKITSIGRESLSSEMSRKNQEGLPRASGKGFSADSRGGNGKPLPLPQQVMLEALGEGWKAEHVIRTRQKRALGYPPHYKADIANPSRKIVVELDGSSHNGKRKAQDTRKDELLTSLGWRVFRFPNVRAVQRTNDCVMEINQSCADGDCPIGATVVSVEPVHIEDYHVYDITVADCHNFYANGILVHNCQDLNACQLALVKKAISPTGRALFVGDAGQAIFGFAGADNMSFANIRREMNTTELPLSICYRCPSSHIRLAQRVVPQIQARPDAPEGEVGILSAEADLSKLVQGGDLVLCRLTAPLIKECIKLIKQKVSARVRGRDIGKDLVSLLERLTKVEGFAYAKAVEHLQDYKEKQIDFLRQKKADESVIESLADRIECLQVCVRSYLNAKSIKELATEINALFDDSRPAVWLSTVHRAKGLEADRVFILRPEKLPLRWKNQQGWQFEQEKNLLYVALTRAKKSLFFLGDLPDLCREESEVQPQREALDAAQDASPLALVDEQETAIAAESAIVDDFVASRNTCYSCEAALETTVEQQNGACAFCMGWAAEYSEPAPIASQGLTLAHLEELDAAIANLTELVHHNHAMYMQDQIRVAAEEVARLWATARAHELDMWGRNEFDNSTDPLRERPLE